MIGIASFDGTKLTGAKPGILKIIITDSKLVLTNKRIITLFTGPKAV
jgi:hypothetical protein